MPKEFGPEQDDLGEEANLRPLTTDWRNALVVDLAGRIRVARRRALAGTLDRRKLDQESGPAAGAATAE